MKWVKLDTIFSPQHYYWAFRTRHRERCNEDKEEHKPTCVQTVSMDLLGANKSKSWSLCEAARQFNSGGRTVHRSVLQCRSHYMSHDYIFSLILLKLSDTSTSMRSMGLIGSFWTNFRQFEMNGVNPSNLTKMIANVTMELLIPNISVRLEYSNFVFYFHVCTVKCTKPP